MDGSRRGPAGGHHPRRGCGPCFPKTSVHTSTGGCGELEGGPLAVAAAGAEGQAEAGSGGPEEAVCPKRVDGQEPPRRQEGEQAQGPVPGDGPQG